MLRPAKGKVRMVISVIPDFVTFIHDPPNESGIAFGIYANQKKCGLYIRGL